MCKHGDDVEVRVTIHTDDSYTGKERVKLAKIDRCLAPLIKLLNEYGIKTTGCCCGHGKTKKSYVGISAMNIHLGKLERSGQATISLEFPYQGGSNGQSNTRQAG